MSMGTRPMTSHARICSLLAALLVASTGCGPAQAPAPITPTPVRPVQVAPDPPPGRASAFDTTADGAAREVWSGLDRTENTCEDTFDYHPRGGMRIFACHLYSLISYERIVQLSPVPIFVGGPHTESALVLDAQQDFGRYNPEFVTWMVDYAIPASRDDAFRAATQPLYDTYVRPLTQILRATYEKFQQFPECLARERGNYMTLLEQQALPDGNSEQFFDFLDAGYCSGPDNGDVYSMGSGMDGNVVKTAVAFWIRRDIDGTAAEFYRGLVLLRETYENGPR